MPDRAAARSFGGRLLAAFGFLTASGLAALSVLGFLGRWDGWADIVNQFAPIWLGLAVVGLLIWTMSRGWRRSPWSGALILFAVAAQGALAGPELLEGARGASSGTLFAHSPAFSVLTFNVWNDSTDPAAVIDRILASGADVVTLQEGLNIERLSSPSLAAAYPYQATCDDWWGCEILILSKRPILDHHFAAPKPEGSGGPLWAVWITTLAPDGHPVRVLSTHFARPIPPDFRESQVDRLSEIVGGLGTGSLVVTGDCNAGGASFALRKQDSALPSLTRRTHAVFSWPAIFENGDRPAPFPFLAIDQVYATRDWRTLDVARLPRSGSDHYPVLVRLARTT